MLGAFGNGLVKIVCEVSADPHVLNCATRVRKCYHWIWLAAWVWSDSHVILHRMRVESEWPCRVCACEWGT